MRRRKFWGWGVEGGGPDEAVTRPLIKRACETFGIAAPEAILAPQIGEIALPANRIREGADSLGRCGATDDPLERAGHTYGKGLRDLLRAFDRDFAAAPDLVCYPASEEEVVQVLDTCDRHGYAVVPYGGGSSVVGGVEPRGLRERYPGVVSLDLSRLGKLLDLDRESRLARFQAGALGPGLEAQLRGEGLTLRHFPQSFEFSSLGGWIATRSGGHFATVFTHIDDFTHSIRAVTPAGIIETRSLPSSGAGPEPKRLLFGSEGSLGVITEASMRVLRRPVFRASATVAFQDFRQAVEAARDLAQSDLHPSNCRLLDPGEAMLNSVRSDGSAVLLVAFESADHPLGPWLDRALEIALGRGGSVAGDTRVSEGESDRAGSGGAGRPEEAGQWRRMFLDAPYIRDHLVRAGFIPDTFETACTWSGFEKFHAGVKEAVTDALDRVCGGGMLTCRFTHVYPDGPAPYYTVIAPGRPGARLAQWDAIKEAASEAIDRLGGATTHHHAVGRDHQPWYLNECPPLVADALRAAKKRLDPRGILNPGVLFDRLN
ncbi:MAG: FAD-binding oxidoreductase [Deltaproteobacteria bacterium]|nr:FAD-binding oxidoreductase [Deltaproteobacteria bacterium]